MFGADDPRCKMMRMWLKRLVVMLPLAMGIALLLIVVIPSPSGTDSQDWYLTATEYTDGTAADDGTIHSGDNVMSMAGPGDSGEFVWIGQIFKNAWTAWWYSENAAECNVTFGEDDWDVEVYYTNLLGTGHLNAEVWSVDTSGNLQRRLANGSESIGTCEIQQFLNIPCPDDGSTTQTVFEGQHLALKLQFVPAICFDGILTLYGKDCVPSLLRNPDSIPGWPTPELPTIALMSMGLVGLGGYVVIKRRRARAAAIA